MAARRIGADADLHGADAAAPADRAGGHVHAPGARQRPRRARRARAASPRRKFVLLFFAGMVALWGAASTLDLDSTAVAFLRLGGLLASVALTLEDIRHEGDALATFIWFAVLFTISGQLNELKFMGFLRNVSPMRSVDSRRWSPA